VLVYCRWRFFWPCQGFKRVSLHQCTCSAHALSTAGGVFLRTLAIQVYRRCLGQDEWLRSRLPERNERLPYGEAICSQSQDCLSYSVPHCASSAKPPPSTRLFSLASYQLYSGDGNPPPSTTACTQAVLLISPTHPSRADMHAPINSIVSYYLQTTCSVPLQR
jgi:hypothetical protein